MGKRIDKFTNWAAKGINNAGDKIAAVSPKILGKGRKNFNKYSLERQQRIDKLEKKAEGGELTTSQAAAARIFGMKGYATAYAESDESKNLGRIVFFLFSFAGFVPLFVFTFMKGGQFPQSLGGMMVVIYIFSTFIGLFGGRSARAPMGIIVMTFVLFSFSFTYTDTVGSTIFGPWWGTIQGTGELFFTPMTEAFTSLNCNTGASFSCITEGPIVCNQRRLECNKKVAQLEGSTQAIEFTTINLQPKEAESGKETIGYIEIENRGDWDAKDVKLTVKKPTAESTKRKEVTFGVGSVTVDACIGGNPQSSSSCFYEGTLAKYDKTRGSGGKGAMQFTLKWDSDLKSKKIPETGLSGIIKDAETNLAGQYVNLTFEASYHYDVSSTYSADVRTSEELKRLLQQGETVSGTQARYSGGPVMASIWTPAYVESGKPSMVVAALSNTRNGMATNARYCLYAPQGTGPSKAKDSDVKIGADATAGEDGCTEKENLLPIKCGGSWTLAKPGTKDANQKSCTFFITANTAEKKRVDIVGEASFDYTVTKSNKEIGILG